MYSRHRISKGKSRRSFTKGAIRTKSKNFAPVPMRGGIRL